MNTIWVRGAMLLGLIGLAAFSTGCEMVPFTASLEVRNQAITHVFELNITPSSNPEWGQNHLEYLLEPNSSKSFTLPVGTYDFRAIDTLGRVALTLNVPLEPNDSKIWQLMESGFHDEPEFEDPRSEM